MRSNLSRDEKRRNANSLRKRDVKLQCFTLFVRLQRVTRGSAQSVSGFLACELLYVPTLRADVEVYRNGFFSKFSPSSNQQSHSRSGSTNSERHTVIRVHHFVASWALQAFLCKSGFFSRSFQVLIQMIV